jgi:hypothetical protein
MSTGIFKTTALRVMGSADVWTAQNPILENGQIGVEIDSNKAKIGDGQTAWNALAYIGASTSAVTSVAGKTGAVALSVVDILGAAPIASPVFTGTVSVPTAPAGDNSTKAASTAFVASAIAGIPGYVLPAATTGTIGGVKKLAAIADLTAAPTQDDFNKLLAAMRAAGLM